VHSRRRLPPIYASTASRVMPMPVKAMNERLKKSTGLKGKELFMPLRLMLTGMDHGPELVRAIRFWREPASRMRGALASRARRTMYSLILVIPAPKAMA